MKDSVITKIGPPEQWLIEAATEIGLDLSGLSHEVTNSFITHIIKQHGDEKSERARGQIAVTQADIAQIPDIVKAPDYAVIGIKRSGETINAYAKRHEDNTTVYYEEILIGRKNKALRSKTMFIKIGVMSIDIFLKILSNNVRSDLSRVKIVVGAGS
ncbi:MAG: hypothetical protein LBG95_03645 [Treponema sp.]|jgi:hypothetical protein|nr:hypothetical protein [Treponema sp.]